MSETPKTTRYTIFARGVCIAKPRRKPLSFWVHAHSPRGHGIHSQLLYTLCREVFFTIFRQKETRSYQERTYLIVELLQAWWMQNPTRALQNPKPDILLVESTALLENIGQQLRVQEVTALPSIILICRPRQDTERWRAWCNVYQTMSAGVVIDLYQWGLLLFVKDIAQHKFALRGFLRG